MGKGHTSGNQLLHTRVPLKLLLIIGDCAELKEKQLLNTEMFVEIPHIQRSTKKKKKKSQSFFLKYKSLPKMRGTMMYHVNRRVPTLTTITNLLYPPHKKKRKVF